MYTNGHEPVNSNDYWPQITTTDSNGQFVDKPIGLCGTGRSVGYFHPALPYSVQPSPLHRYYYVRHQCASMLVRHSGRILKGQDYPAIVTRR